MRGRDDHAPAGASLRIRRRRDRSAWVEASHEVTFAAWFMRALGFFWLLLLTPFLAVWGAVTGAIGEVTGTWRAWWKWCAFALLLTATATSMAAAARLNACPASWPDPAHRANLPLTRQVGQRCEYDHFFEAGKKTKRAWWLHRLELRLEDGELFSVVTRPACDPPAILWTWSGAPYCATCPADQVHSSLHNTHDCARCAAGEVPSADQRTCVRPPAPVTCASPFTDHAGFCSPK